MIRKFLLTSALLAIGAIGSHAKAETLEEVTVCQLAKNPTAYSGKRIRIRAIYSYMFEVSRLKSPTCCPESGSLIWVDFDEGKAEGLLRQLPEGMGVVLAVFVGTVETGKVYGSFGERVRLVVDRIEKIEQREHHPHPNRSPKWVPQNCEH